jgi:hypothetical protein
MDSDTLKTIGAIAGPILAIISIAVNFYQFRQNTSLHRQIKATISPTIRKDEIRDSLNSLVTNIDSSRILTAQPHHEHWMFGFPSLEDMRSLCAAANTIVANSPIPPDHIRLLISEMLSKIRSVVYYRDGFDQLQAGRPYIEVSDYETWIHKRDAENALHDLQQYVRSRETQLRDYLQQLNE